MHESERLLSCTLHLSEASMQVTVPGEAPTAKIDRLIHPLRNLPGIVEVTCCVCSLYVLGTFLTLKQNLLRPGLTKLGVLAELDAKKALRI